MMPVNDAAVPGCALRLSRLQRSLLPEPLPTGSLSGTSKSLPPAAPQAVPPLPHAVIRPLARDQGYDIRIHANGVL